MSQGARLCRVGAFLTLLAPLTGCSDGAADGPGPQKPSSTPPASFIDVQIALQASGCTEGGCHSPPGQAGLELVDAPWDNLVHAPVAGCDATLHRQRVVPGDPEHSYLLNKLRGMGLCSGTRMPKGCDDTLEKPCMNRERISLIDSWIAGGASRE